MLLNKRPISEWRHLRTLQTGQNATISQQLLNQIAAAKQCLMNPATRATYDARLRSTTGRPVRSASSAPAKASVERPKAMPQPLPIDEGSLWPEQSRAASPASVADRTKRRARRKLANQKQLIVGAVTSALVLIGLFTVWVTKPSSMATTASSTQPAEEPGKSTGANVVQTPISADRHTDEPTTDDRSPQLLTEAPQESKEGNRERDGVIDGAATEVTPSQMEPSATEIDSNPNENDPLTGHHETETKTTDKNTSVKRTEVPAKADQAAADAKIKDLFREDLAKAKTAQDFAALSAKLVELAGQTDDSTERYALLAHCA